MNKLGKSFGERRSVHPLLGERERERERVFKKARFRGPGHDPKKFQEEVFSLQENLRY